MKLFGDGHIFGINPKDEGQTSNISRAVLIAGFTAASAVATFVLAGPIAVIPAVLAAVPAAIEVEKYLSNAKKIEKENHPDHLKNQVKKGEIPELEKVEDAKKYIPVNYSGKSFVEALENQRKEEKYCNEKVCIIPSR